MPAISDHHSSETTKLLFVGDSGSGKTGALASLASAGYNLRIIDLDNGIDVLKNYLLDANSPYRKLDPDCHKRVHYVTLTDKMKNLNGQIFPLTATAWQKSIELLSEWKDGEINLGKLTDWTPKDILVIDSLSMLSQAAVNFHLAMNGALSAKRTQNEARRDIGVAQNMIRSLLTMLYDSSVKCNVIVTSHITFVTETGGAPNAEAVGQLPATGYPSAIGRALSPHIPRWFNNVLIARAIGSGAGERHRIFTKPQSIGGQIINAKNSAPLRVAPEYPLETGLADYFKAIRGS